MGRFLKIAVPTFALGVVFGAAFWYLASPLWIDNVVDEVLVEKADSRVIAWGEFTGVDAVHQGSGTAKIVQMADGSHQVQFSDFQVTNGPDLKVWLISHPAPEASKDVKSSEQLRLSPLKGNIGDQFYSLPDGSDPALYKSVIIYCQQFGVLFASAPLG